MAKKKAATKATRTRAKKSVRTKTTKAAGGSGVKRTKAKKTNRQQTFLPGTEPETHADIDRAVRKWRKVDAAERKKREAAERKVEESKARVTAAKQAVAAALIKHDAKEYKLGHLEEFNGQKVVLSEMQAQVRLKKVEQEDA